MTSGGIRTSVKAYINVQRVAALAATHENNEAINTHLAEIAEASMAAASTSSYGLCDGNMPCLPILSSANKSCEANQLPSGSDPISVNGEPLSPEEMVKLQTCPNPPKKLKPGCCYWYDNVSGFWGKEGQKPSDVISPYLHVGGGMKQNASNGSTQVFINGREITKAELRMLQLVGVNCAGNPHFWVYENGAYQEEGMTNIIGSIWETPGTKIVCALLSLPAPFKSSTSVIPEIIEPERNLQKMLLVGCNGSGANTIFKQAKILYEAIPFSVDERESIKSTIQRNVYKYLAILLEVRERFHEECLAKRRPQPLISAHSAKTPYAIAPKLKTFADWLVKTAVSGYLEAIFPAATREFAAFVEELWNDAAIQATYQRSCENIMLSSVASYFIERAVHILKVNYEPTDQDILYAEGDTSSNELACVELSLPQSKCEYGDNSTDQHDTLVRYKLIRANAGLEESSEWLENYEDVELVIFCVSLSDYDQFSADGINKMLKDKAVFENIVTHPSFEEMNFLLLLNDFDLFVKKIDQEVPLAQCDWFVDFKPAYSSARGQQAYEYIAVKFKRLFSSLTGKKLYVSRVEEFDSDSVVAALKYSTEILKWDRDHGYYTDLFYDSFYSDSESDLD